MFARLGQWIARRPLVLIAIWAVAVAAGVAWTISAEDVPPGDINSFLPADSPHNRAMALFRQAFPKLAARSQVVVIAHRPTGLTSEDFYWLDGLARRAHQVTARPVLSPTVPFLRHRLVSPQGQAAMVVVNLASNFVSAKTMAAVEQVTEIAGADRPAGLTIEITGSAGIGRDYFHASQRAVHRTTWVTIVAVLVILLVVYRSPVGALVPLVSIGASVYLAFVLLGMLARNGWDISNMERVFAVVLLFGAGVDYALFWIARYREALQQDMDFQQAAESATRTAGPAILASAGTTICGLTCLLATDLLPSRSAGRVLAPVLVVALLAALTLSPSLARVLGRGLFWPIGAKGTSSIGQRLIWPPIARRVTRRPGTLLLLGMIVLGVPALLAWRIEPRFDSLGELPPGSSSARGFDLAHEHFPEGQLYSNTLLLDFAASPEALGDLRTISRAVTDRLRQLAGVLDVYALDAPLGQLQPKNLPLIDSLLTPIARAFYESESLPVLRLEILINHMPFTPEAMAVIEKVKAATEEAVSARTGPGQAPRILLAGLTPYIMGVRDVAGRDQRRVMVLATVVIALIVLVLIRDLPLTLFMLLATWLTYGATLCLSEFFFVHVMGLGGLDWKVRLIIFVILVAVGQDYNIFLVTRLLQEPPEVDDAEAARRAIVSTGAVISSCGIIMAATLGSLWAGGLSLLQQTGFTLALGILIDTFFVRPLLIPSFFLATRRRRSVGARTASKS